MTNWKEWNSDYRRSGFQAAKGSNLRCNICNKVSHGDISSDYGYHTTDAFMHDPEGFGYLCHECAGEIADVKAMWDIEDDLDYEFDPDEEFYFDE